MLSLFRRQKKSLDDVLKTIKTKKGKAEAILSAIYNEKTTNPKYVRKAISILAGKGEFLDAAELAERHGFIVCAVKNYQNAGEDKAAGELAYISGRKTLAGWCFLEAREYERAKEVFLEIGKKKLAIGVLEKYATRLKEVSFFGGEYDPIKTHRKQSAKYREAAILAREIKDKRAKNLYKSAVKEKLEELISLRGDGKHIDISELLVLGEEWGDEKKFSDVIKERRADEMIGRLALARGKTKKAEQIFMKILEEKYNYLVMVGKRDGYEYTIHDFIAHNVLLKELKSLHPQTAIKFYDKYVLFDKSARLSRKIGYKAQAKKYEELSNALA